VCRLFVRPQGEAHWFLCSLVHCNLQLFVVLETLQLVERLVLGSI
jgi:hypothetical protein